MGQIYIPAPSHYIQAGAATTPLSQMQVVADFAEISRIAYEQPSHYTSPAVIQKDEHPVLNFKKPRHKALGRLEDEEGDADSRDDGFILGLFESDQASTQTTLD